MKFIKSLSILSLCTLAACQTVYMPKAREVKKKPNSNGVIAIPAEFRPEDRQKAESLMTQNCGVLKYIIADEGEVVVGQKTTSSASSTQRDDSRKEAGNLFGIPLISGSAGGTDTTNDATTTQLKEWQITYNCEAEVKNKR